MHSTKLQSIAGVIQSRVRCTHRSIGHLYLYYSTYGILARVIEVVTTNKPSEARTLISCPKSSMATTPLLEGLPCESFDCFRSQLSHISTLLTYLLAFGKLLEKVTDATTSIATAPNASAAAAIYSTTALGTTFCTTSNIIVLASSGIYSGIWVETNILALSFNS